MANATMRKDKSTSTEHNTITHAHKHIMGRQTNLHAYAYSYITQRASEISAEGASDRKRLKVIVLSHFFFAFEYNQEFSVVLRTLNAC